VDEPSTTVERLVDSGEIACFIGHLRQELMNCSWVVALVDGRVRQHLVQSICPVLAAVETKLVATGTSHIL